jgi:hypothetical protein
MALQPVKQENYSGCFVAAIATLLGKTYRETFEILHPGQDPALQYDHGFLDVSVQNAAFTALQRAGIKGHLTNRKKFKTYAKRSQHALLIIRWKFQPYTLCHTIVYDGDEHKFIDPSWGRAVRDNYTLASLEEQLEFGIVIDEIPKELEQKHESQRRFGNGGQLSQWGASPQYYHEIEGQSFGYWGDPGFGEYP